MKRRTKEEMRVFRNESRLDKLVQEIRFFRDPKYYKNNYWSWAAWDSWAAQGAAGSCGCGCGHYNAALNNKRYTTNKGGRGNTCKSIIERLCSDCVRGIEKRLNVKFDRR